MHRKFGLTQKKYSVYYEHIFMKIKITIQLQYAGP